MNRQPSHPAAYEGRPLPRPNEEIVDQGLAFDVDTLIGRRRLLRALGLGVAAIGLAACTGNTAGGTTASAARSTSPASGSSSSAGSTTSAASTTGGDAFAEIPDETAGPYPGDGSNGPDVLTQSGIVRSDITSSFGESTGTADGIPMTLELTIRDLARGGVPFAGVAVYVWHCDREGNYSMYSQAVADQNYLRGVQIADADGVVRYTSIFPACYSGRWPHIHFEVYPDQAGIADASNAISTSQVALPEAICNEVYATPGYEASVKNLSQVTLKTDGVFGDDGGVSQLGTVTGSVSSGYAVALTAAVDTTTTPTGGGAPAGGTGGGPGGPPPNG